MLDLISIGTISIDLYFKGKDLEMDKHEFHLDVGKKYRADYLYEGIGGSATNVSAAATLHGLQTGVLGFVGNNPFKDMILAELKKLKISDEFCQFRDKYLNISTIFLTEKGERTIINYRPPHGHISDSKDGYDKFLAAKAYHLGNLPDVSLTERESFLALLKKNNKTIFLNLGVKDCQRPLDQIKGLISHIDVLILNAYEFSLIRRKDYKDIDFKENAVKHHPELSGKIVVVTDAAKGSYGYSDDAVVHQEAISPEKIIDTTGAGDAYSGAFIAKYLQTKDISESMKVAAHHAAKIIGKVGAN